MANIQDQIDEHEKRLTAIEVSSARIDERLDALVKSTDNLRKCVQGFMFGFGLIMLLAICYGALGDKGFNQVVKSSPPLPLVEQQTKPQQ